MTALDVFQSYLRTLGEGYRENKDDKERVIAVWRFNNCPSVVSCPDVRHGDDWPVYFVFTLGVMGPTFTLHYTLPLAESMGCPPDIAAIGTSPAAAPTEASAATADSPSRPEPATPDARTQPTATLTAI